MDNTIEQLESWTLDIPTIRPHQLSMATMGCQTLTLLKLTFSDGICGWGEATTIGGLSYGPESPETIKSTLDHYFSPLLTGKSFHGLSALVSMLNQQVKGNLLAKSALETAWLDAQGKRLGVPVSTLLGGARDMKIPVLWTLASGDTQRDIDEGRQLLAQGRHRAFKLKIGARSLVDDLHHCKAIQQALGAEASIRVDVNQAWDYTSALRGIAALQDIGIDLVEQPLALWDRAGMVELSRRFTLPLLADEAVADARDGYALAASGFRGAYALKIAKAGGPMQVLKLAQVAEAAGVELYGGTMLEGTLGTVAALHAWSTLSLPWGSEMFGPLLLKDDVVSTPLRYGNGIVELPGGSGLGVEIDTDKLAFYQRK